MTRSRQIIRQLDCFARIPDLVEAEQFWLEVIKQSFEELMQRAAGTPGARSRLHVPLTGAFFR
jgi:hypothetical protein